MTCIIGLIEAGTVYLAADSAGVMAHQVTIHKDKKLFRNGDFLFGCTTSFRMIQLLRYSFTPPTYEPGTDIEGYMATKFIDAVRHTLTEGGFAMKDKDREQGGRFLVGFHGRLFRVDPDYQVAEPASGYDSVGSGDEIALGALFATRELGLSPEERLTLALRAAAHHTTGVREPFFIERVTDSTDEH